jgi:phage terminase small subunit
MPRRSKAALTVASVHSLQQRLEPPADLVGPARDVFRETVASVPAPHFRPEDVPLLRVYCEAIVMARRAAAEVAARAVVEAAPTPWLKVQMAQVRIITMLSVRLRLGARSRDHHVRQTTRAGRPPSFYDTVMANPEEWP